MTLAYLRDTAQQAGLKTLQMYMEEIGWNDEQKDFLDPNEDPMLAIFKLYPWEAMLGEEFGTHALETYQQVRWIEPVWKLLSNKGILPVLWQLYPNHELLLPAYFDTAAVPQPVDTGGGWQEVRIPGAATVTTTGAPLGTAHGMGSYVRKPLFSREGANITLVQDGVTLDSTDGPYTGRQLVQGLAPEAIFADRSGNARYPILGLWMVDQECCGMGIREAPSPITDNRSSFVPHYFR